VNSTYWRRDQNGKWYNAGNRPAGISSNDSYETLSSDINAKNLLVVGAVNGIGASYSKKEDVVMSSFSSWGPTDDGRIKPDIVADGVSVYSSIATNDSSYAALNGTSMATPNAAGSLLLLQELSQQLSPKKFIKAATLKALAIHTANEAGDAPGPDYKFGWGLLNMYDAANVLSNALTTKNSETSKDFVYENVLNNLDSNSCME
jgi:subtilisin family serine protease